ncbi:MAG: DUF6062 family protein [Bacteroidota bacterium]
MKERIYTIPLSEVLIPGAGCPFCHLAAKAEPALLRVYLEGLLVDVGWRGRVLDEWLCRRHLAGMQTETRRLGGAIVVQALLRQALADLSRDGDAPLPAWGSSCLACRDVHRTLLQHAGAFLHTWATEPEFRAMVARADPFCLPHLSLLHRETARLPLRHRRPVRADLRRLGEKTLAPLLAGVDWFVRKHDARYRDAAWDGAEDAVEKAIAALTSGE